MPQVLVDRGRGQRHLLRIVAAKVQHAHVVRLQLHEHGLLSDAQTLDVQQGIGDDHVGRTIENVIPLQAALLRYNSELAAVEDRSEAPAV